VRLWFAADGTADRDVYASPGEMVNPVAGKVLGGDKIRGLVSHHPDA
jgi:hypothetical protein